MKKITLVLLTFITITNIAHSQALKFTSKGRKYLRSIKNTGLTYTNTGNEFIDSLMTASLDEYWTSTKVYLENSLDDFKINNSNFNIVFKEHTYEITDYESHFSRSYTNKYIYFISKEKLNSGIEKLNINTTILRKTIDSYGTYINTDYIEARVKLFDSIQKDLFTQEEFELIDFRRVGLDSNSSNNENEFYKKIFPFCIKSLNDCYKTIVDNPEINNFEKLYDKINETNTYRVKGKTFLFLGENYQINYKRLEKEGIKYEITSFNEFKNFNKEELSKYVLVSYGSDPWMILTLQDPITMDLLYINQHMNINGLKKCLNDFQSYLD